MIKYYNRYTQKYHEETVAGNKSLNLIYGNPHKLKFLPELASIKIFSQIYGFLCDLSLSKLAIPKFIKNFNINMSDYTKVANEYKSFNEFFYRELTDNSRPIDMNEAHFISPCDSKLLAINKLTSQSTFNVKGFKYDLSELIKDKDLSEKYKNGTCLIFRLCPTDYHRFHFVDYGTCSNTTHINGKYYSVNPIALKSMEKLFCENKREYSVFKTKNFDDILYVEIGATFVGSIIQTYNSKSHVNKGDEKGYFKFGGSTVILFIKENTLLLDEDILKQSSLGIETQVHMGEKIGIKL